MDNSNYSQHKEKDQHLKKLMIKGRLMLIMMRELDKQEGDKIEGTMHSNKNRMWIKKVLKT